MELDKKDSIVLVLWAAALTPWNKTTALTSGGVPVRLSSLNNLSTVFSGFKTSFKKMQK